MMVTRNDIHDMECTLESATFDYLRNMGWKHTCNTPGSYWLWEKKLGDGRIILVSADYALNMQDRMDFLDTQAEWKGP